MTVTIYHNPRCSKCRQTLALLQDRGLSPNVIEYLNTPPDARTLSELLAKLELQPMDIIRTGEPAFKEARDEIQSMSVQAQLEWLANNPEALQRPIIVTGDRACIGRPPETVLDILP